MHMVGQTAAALEFAGAAVQAAHRAPPALRQLFGVLSNLVRLKEEGNGWYRERRCENRAAPSPPLRQLSLLRWRRACVWFCRCSYQRAVDAYTQALSLDPAASLYNAVLHMNRAVRVPASRPGWHSWRWAGLGWGGGGGAVLH